MSKLDTTTSLKWQFTIKTWTYSQSSRPATPWMPLLAAMDCPLVQVHGPERSIDHAAPSWDLLRVTERSCSLSTCAGFAWVHSIALIIIANLLFLSLCTVHALTPSYDSRKKNKIFVSFAILLLGIPCRCCEANRIGACTWSKLPRCMQYRGVY